MVNQRMLDQERQRTYMVRLSITCSDLYFIFITFQQKSLKICFLFKTHLIVL